MTGNRIPNKNFIRLILAAFLVIAAFSEAASEESGDTEKELEEKRKETEDVLKFGIDSEVLTVLGNLKSEKDASFNDLLTKIYTESRYTSIKQEIIRLWNDTEYEDGLPFAREEIQKVVEDEDFEPPLVKTALSYIAVMHYEEASPELTILTDYRDDEIAAAAIRAVGAVGSAGNEAVGEGLLTRLKKEDPAANEDLVAALIVTLGEIKYEPAAQELVYIAEDEGASAGHRRLACVSIGKIGREEDFSVVERLYYESDDAMLRAYALAGLAEFTDRDSSDVLISALKRDSFWKIRVTAAQHMESAKGDDLDEMLRYKASHDPVNQVRITSLKALGIRAGSENDTYLIDYFSDKSRGIDLRIACLNVLLENKTSGTADAVKNVMDEEWDSPGRFLEFICRELSRAEWKALAPLYEKMLDHKNWLIPVYGIRGIRKNGIQSLEGKIAALDADGVDGRIRREVTGGS